MTQWPGRPNNEGMPDTELKIAYLIIGTGPVTRY